MKNRSLFRKSLLVHSVGLALCTFGAYGETFNSSLLVGNSADMDWSNTKLVMTPGPYDLDVYVNSVWRGKFSLIVANDDKGTLQIKREDVPLLDIQELDAQLKKNSADLINVNTLLHGGKSKLVPGELRLDLEVPQAFVATKNRNWVAPQKWDQGINGIYTNYNVNYYNFHGLTQGYTDSDNLYLSLNSGLNLYGWHLLDNSAWMRYSSMGQGYWINTTRYVEKPIAAIGSVMRLGRSYTTSDYFDTVRFRGLTLNKSRQMMPDSERVYMPVISGIATSSATVSVFQDGHIIHQITVPPGPFAIRDLMPTGSRGDLSVEVKNSSGNVERFVVPFSSIPDMLRPGTSDYQFNVGEVDMRGVDDHSTFAQVSYSRGINNYVTASAGGIWNNDYQSLLLGGAVSLPYAGSLSASVEESQYRLPNDGRRHGEKYSLSWSKYFPTRTNVSLASYYYRTQDYASFSDFILTKSNIKDYGGTGTSTVNSKQAFSATISQPLAEGFGRLSLSAYWRDYWRGQKSSKQYNLTWSNAINSVNYSVSLRRSEVTQSYYDYETNYEGDMVSALRSRGNTENNLYFSVTVPMSIFGSGGSISSHASVQNGKYSSSDVSLSGSASDVDYSLMLTHDSDGNSRSTDFYTSWKNSYTNLNSGLTMAREYRQASLGASGNILAWGGGVLTSPNNGRNFVILEAPGVENAVVNGDTSTRTNGKGIALVTSATPYRQNNFHLEQDGTESSDVDLQGNLLNVAPYEGSITYLKYKTDTRKLFTLNAQAADGSQLPFGAFVTGMNNEELGYVAQGSQIFIKSDQMPEKISVNISKGKVKKTCVISHPTEQNLNTCR
ncbi:outer membrane usher protein [Serratia fonticola]|jgi:outer membrane usher protein|uniref:Outer membrane usher protein n=1 Tax=Serratia fonticola TaxID=47917 RepID=A0A559T553_SERFO|nr:fimbria/pilus outer membrane usher protein [Serratia fonticola]TQI77792.1 outer membrane usher protein [Serratia fonticola]TQI95213.1 outer membrane usher protein [Serratia fonticola]TVZ69710.1 outer membrane usher protein [Serratia fonticola]